MTAIRCLLATLGVCILIAGCRKTDESARSPTGDQPASAPAIGTPASAVDLDKLIVTQGSVTFRSFGGKWIGMDGDTDLTFFPNGAAHMFEYGIGVSGYSGTYTVDQRGNITLQLPTFGHGWPVMSLRSDATSLLLVPAGQNSGQFVMGNRGGATFAPGQGTYWPFRPLDPAETAQVRKRIGR